MVQCNAYNAVDTIKSRLSSIGDYIVLHCITPC